MRDPTPQRWKKRTLNDDEDDVISNPGLTLQPLKLAPSILPQDLYQKLGQTHLI